MTSTQTPTAALAAVSGANLISERQTRLAYATHAQATGNPAAAREHAARMMVLNDEITRRVAAGDPRMADDVWVL